MVSSDFECGAAVLHQCFVFLVFAERPMKNRRFAIRCTQSFDYFGAPTTGGGQVLGGHDAEMIGVSTTGQSDKFGHCIDLCSLQK